jgi:starch-binding outer membrane protein, SusD/RagB family
MKYFKKTNIILILSVLLFSGCKDILEESPKTIITPDSFSSATGLRSGLSAAYSISRAYYGHELGSRTTVYGTDEYHQGQPVNDAAYAVYIALHPALAEASVPWNDAYIAINTCNGLIELGPDVEGLLEEEKSALIAQAKFLRGHWYFLLARHYGGATLDLGSGSLAFNQNPSSALTRDSEDDVLAAVINDLEDAVDELPESRPSEPGRVWKASALHLLAKAYLYRGWKNNSTTDFQSALDNANDLITNRATYGVDLLSSFEDVFVEDNEWSDEVLYSVEWNGNAQFNDATNSGAATNNIQNFLFREFYVSDIPGMVRDVKNGRPWIRYSPSAWMLDVAFNDKENDERYYASFQTVWLANTANAVPKWSADNLAAGHITDASLVGQPKFTIGDTALWHAPLSFQQSFADQATLDEWVSKRGFVVSMPTTTTPTSYNGLSRNDQNKHFPSLKKFNRVARPIAGTESDPNIGATRPYIVHRFAETYLVAAEAAIKLSQNSVAVPLINAVRNRSGASSIVEADLVGAHGDAIDFILDERTRELAGEHKRWLDLKRTQRLLERVSGNSAVGTGASAVYNRQFNNGAAVAGRRAPDPQPHHYKRPVPQSAIDANTIEYPQNEGY